MAARIRNSLLSALLLLPMISLAYKPSSLPTNLFSPHLKDAHLPEGVRKITWRHAHDHESAKRTSNFWYSAKENLSRTRSRRDAFLSSPSILETNFPKEPYDASLFKQWSGNTIILYAKKKSRSTNVYLSSNFGKTWTKINSKLDAGKAHIDQVYLSHAKPTLCFLTDIQNRFYYITTDYIKFHKYGPLAWEPSYIVFHPTDPNRVMGYDSPSKKLYLSVDKGVSFAMISDKVRTFWWGHPGLDANNVIYIDKIKRELSPKSYTAIKVVDFVTDQVLLDDIDELELMKNYMFATKTLPNGKITLKVSYNRGPFVDAEFPVTENNRDYFVYDVINDQVFIVINHFKNESNLYISDIGGVKYTLSLPRVLYHNPYTDVSSQWLKELVKHAFVDIYKVETMRGVYVATQLTPGPVGRRHLLSMITYNRGASWGKIRSPTRDINGLPIFCYMPSCSLHFNLKYGSVYQVSPSENLLSSKSAPGLVLAKGVASTNLKIHPDTFLSTDGGVNWKRVLRGKHQYSFGNYGGAIVAAFYGRNTNMLKYSVNGGESFNSIAFSKSQVLVQDIITHHDHKQAYFLIFGMPVGKQPWKIFHVNMTAVLGKPCQKSDFMYWVPGSDMKECELGRADNYTIRNWTRTCYLTENHNVPKIQTNCTCTIDDFECDFGYVRNASHFICYPVIGEDLVSGIIPNICPEGSTYKRSSGYRKIPGNTCVGGEEKRFLPKDSLCPVKKLSGLKVTTHPAKAQIIVSQSVAFSATLSKGYVPNIKFRWDFGDGFVKNGTGSSYQTVSHSFTKSGRFTVVLTVTNTRSILIKILEVNVEEKLSDKNIDVSYHPDDPSVAQKVVFMAIIVGLPIRNVGFLTYTWFIDSKKYTSGLQPFFKTVFNASKEYNVQVSVNNLVSDVNKVISVKVSKDIRPLNVKATSLGPTAVDVTWSPPLEPTQYLGGFKVFKSVKRLSDYQECGAVNSRTTSFLVSSLMPSTTYYFKVLAFTRNTEGAFSDISVARTNDSDPGPPRDLRAYPLSSTSIRVEWKAPKNDFGRIKSYVLHWSATEHPQSLQKNLPSSARYYDLVKLTQDTEYTFQLIAKFASGQSFAGPVLAKSNTSKPVLPPRDFKEISNNGTCTNLIWNAPLLKTGSTREFPAKGYKIYVSGVLKVNLSGRNAKVCGFTPGKTYAIEILAYSVVGGGPKASLQISLKSIRSSPPTNVRGLAMTSRKIKIQWEAPLHPNGDVKSYTIYQRKPITSDVGITVTPKTFSQVIGNLLPYTKYVFTVVAANQAGESQPSQQIIVLTHEEIPSAPRFIKAEIIEPESATIRLSWSQPAHPNGKISGYEIAWGKTSISEEQYSQQKQEVSNKLTYTFSHLYSNTEYTFMVASINGAGRSLSYSNHTQQFTQNAIDGTKRLTIQFLGKKDTAEKDFEDNFIKAISRQARIESARVAALKIKDITVEFDIMPNLKRNGTLISAAIASLNTSFNVGQAKTAKGSLRVVYSYNTRNTIRIPKPNDPGVLGARSSNRKTEKSNLALIIVLTLIGLLLLAGLMFAISFYYRRYKPLEQHFSNISSIYRTDNDEIDIAYPGDTGHGKDPSTKQKKNIKNHRSEEKMPLGEHDELSLA